MKCELLDSYSVIVNSLIACGVGIYTKTMSKRERDSDRERGDERAPDIEKG